MTNSAQDWRIWRVKEWPYASQRIDPVATQRGPQSGDRGRDVRRGRPRRGQGALRGGCPRCRGAPPAAGAVVVDVTEASFQAEVLDRSFQVPVLLDLWADWCQPCKQLSPILERLAAEDGGSWVLAKIDVEANQRISQVLQVQGIPAVFAVIGGQLVPGFEGALPEPQVREFVAAVLQAGREAGLTGAVAGQGGADAEVASPDEPEDPRFTAAEEALEEGTTHSPPSATRRSSLRNPATNWPRSRCARWSCSAASSRPIPRLPPAPMPPPMTSERSWRPRTRHWPATMSTVRLARLLDALRRMSGEDREAVRRRLVEYLELLGPEDPRVAPARREMARALF